MAGKLSFSIAINLLTENFKRGTNQVKSSFRAMQMQVLTFVAALGAGGIGLSNLVSRFIDVARETNRVTTALKNVSGGMAQFADNQRFLLEMAKRYGLEINALTGNYAKFTAAASISGMSMMDQRKIFESMSRAVTAFGMSADDSNGVFLALSQMMSKGKISSEELRLQMGERLPIALQAMAKAAGTSVAGLDKLLKQGKLMSADVLPKFAEALNEMIPNVDTDNLETSVNRLKNTFTEFTNSLDVQGKYKGLVDWLTGVLSSIQTKISGIAAFIITLISGKLLQVIINYFSGLSKRIDTTVNQSKVAEEQKLLHTQKRVEAAKAYEAIQTAYETTENGKRLASASQLRKAKGALEKAQLAEKRAVEAAKTAAEKAAAVQSTTIWGRSAKVIKLAWVNLVTTVRSLLSAIWPMALISAIGALIGYLKNAYDEAKRIKGIFSEYKKGLELSVNTDEISKLQKLLAIMNDRKRKQDEINAAQSELQRILGIEKVSQDELNKLVQKRIELLKEVARSEYAANEIAAAESKNLALARGVGMSDKQMERLSQLYVGKDTSKQNREYYYQAVGKEYGKNGVKGRYDTEALDKALKEYIQNTKVIADATNVMAEAQASAATIVSTAPPPVEPSEELQKQQEKYAQSLRELNARREVEKMTVDEYNKGYAELNKKFLIDAMASDDKSIVNSDYARNLAVEYRNAMQSIITSASSEILNNIQKEIESEDIRPDVTPILGKRDTTFDYKKTETDWLSEELSIWEEYKKNLQNAVNDGATYMQDTLNNAMSKVTSLGEALKIAQVKQDIKDFSKELNENLYSGIKDIASSSDRMVSAFRNLRDVLNDVDASGWEQIMAVWNAMTNTIDGIMSIIKTIETLTELTNRLAEAKKAEAVIDKVSADEKVVNAAKGAAATIAETQVEKSAATTEVAANTAKGASAAGASAAKLPFPWNIVAIGGAIAAAIAAFAVIPKFASGGIVAGGPSSGDKILARVNAGEMILNGRQQSNLFEAINSGKLGSTQSQSVNIGFDRVRGSDIFLSLKNYMKSTGKKL